MQNQKYLEVIDNRLKELIEKTDLVINSKSSNCYPTDKCNKHYIYFQYEGNYGDNTIARILRIMEE